MIDIIKCIIRGLREANKLTPKGVPIITPIRRYNTNLQLILFQMLGIIKKLATISSIRIIGTISFGGKINDKSETLDAEKPKPLNPLTKDAISMIIVRKINSNKLSSIILKYCIYLKIVMGSNLTSNQLSLISKCGPVALPLIPNVPTI